MDKTKTVNDLRSGNLHLGIEFGSTRIKAILLNSALEVIASGIYDWENKLIDGYWTYEEDEILFGLKACYQNLKNDVIKNYEVKIHKIKNIGISAMMHGYIVLDENDDLLVPFRTWRNTKQEKASESLTDLYDYPMPQRFSNAHLYQAILNDEEHVKKIKFQTTLAGYIHYLLTGEKVIGIGDASGMFPIDSEHKDFSKHKLELFNDILKANNIKYSYEDVLPKVLLAGSIAGKLSSEGALLLDEELESGSVFCPPEGDAGTGMIATNSITQRTGNVSAGTSVFAMIVLEKELSKNYRQIDLVTTPLGEVVAMVHCNNCTSNLNRYMQMFDQLLKLFKTNINQDELYNTILSNALSSELDVGNLLSYEFLSGEDIVNLEEGRTLFLTKPDVNFNLENFVMCSLYSSLATLSLGMQILEQEGVKIDKIYGHGGLFKTPVVGQRVMSQACRTKVALLSNASEGGAWGIALLAAFLDSEKKLEDYLETEIFIHCEQDILEASIEEKNKYLEYLDRFKNGLEIVSSAYNNY